MGQLPLITEIEAERARKRRVRFVLCCFALLIFGICVFSLKPQTRAQSPHLETVASTPVDKSVGLPDDPIEQPKEQSTTQKSSNEVENSRSVASSTRGTGAQSLPDNAAESAVTSSTQFNVCSQGVRLNCVVDGDTFWMNGEKFRIADIDAPELQKPQCAAEYEKAKAATSVLLEWLNIGAFAYRVPPERTDRYGRTLVILSRNGQVFGDSLVSQQLAHPWNGHKLPWCQIS